MGGDGNVALTEFVGGLGEFVFWATGGWRAVGAIFPSLRFLLIHRTIDRPP